MMISFLKLYFNCQSASATKHHPRHRHRHRHRPSFPQPPTLFQQSQLNHMGQGKCGPLAFAACGKDLGADLAESCDISSPLRVVLQMADPLLVCGLYDPVSKNRWVLAGVQVPNADIS